MIENTELHILEPGQRAQVVLCRVKRNDEMRMHLTACSAYVDDIHFYVEVKGNGLLAHECYPPRVDVALKKPNYRGTYNIFYSTGFLYDMNIMSDVKKMILMINGWTSQIPVDISNWIRSAVA